MPDLSENHLDWWNGFNFFYNADLDFTGPDALYFGSGNFRVAAAYLSRGAGPIWELGPWTDETAPPEYDINFDYFYVGDIEWHILEPDLSNINLLKQSIMTNGALSSCINWNEEYITGFDHYQSPATFPPPNHAIAIVGWDDDRITPAPLPGAWLCKNNYGEGYMDGGYFWVSYYDKHCCRHPEAGVYSFRNADLLPNGYFYNHFYAYDYHGWRRTKADSDEAFNAFVAPRDQILRSASFYTADDSVTYTVKVYDNFTSGQLEGELASATGIIEHLGFHTVDLGADVNLPAGEDFYIYLNLSAGGQPYDCTAPVEATFGIISNGIIVPSKSEPGQSYYHDGSAWLDMYDFDSTANFCIKGIASELAPLPVDIMAVRDGGDGQSILAVIQEQNPDNIDSIIVCAEDTVTGICDTIILSPAETDVLFDGLVEDHLYRFHAVAVDKDSRHSRAYRYAYGIPRSLPAQPQNLETLTLHNAIWIGWGEQNTELDFSHYTIFRDGAPLPAQVTDTFFIDNDVSLGSDFHTYLVAAVDTGANLSDTAGIETVSMKAALLRPGEILAVNRSGSNPTAMVDENVTGEFLREALDGMSFTYFSDSAAANPDRAGLMNLIDYELVVIGAESARQDDIGGEPDFGGILDEIGYYLSIGGRAIVFGRWGDIAIEQGVVDTVIYYPGNCDAGYSVYFNIDYRVVPRTYINAANVVLESDLVGAHSQVVDYPQLDWDSVAAAAHSGALSDMTGIPCASYSVLAGSDHEIIYTYNSGTDEPLTEGMPVAWRSTGGEYEYVFFDIPLSFMERGSAIAALRQAVGDLGIISDIEDNDGTASLPREYRLSQNYPNPFNPTTVIEFYNPEPRPAKVTLTVYNILGQRVRELFNGAAVPGLNEVEWDGADQSGNAVASGIYFYRLKTEKTSLTRKMIMLK